MYKAIVLVIQQVFCDATSVDSQQTALSRSLMRVHTGRSENRLDQKDRASQEPERRIK